MMPGAILGICADGSHDQAGIRRTTGRQQSERVATSNPCRLPAPLWVRFPLAAIRHPSGGAPCKSAPVTGRRRCRMHGGADGSGAPEGSKNGNYKHGRYTEEVQATRQWLREATKLLRGFK